VSRRPSQSGNMVVLVEHAAFAAAFAQLYSQGMTLIDQASAYFSGEGRQAAQRLGHEAAIVYACEVKRLSYRLMQIASWLLLQRAMREQDMTADVLARQKKSVALDMQPAAHDHALWDELPPRFRILSEETWRFIERARCMESPGSHATKAPAADSNPVNEQLLKLKNAFDKLPDP